MTVATDTSALQREAWESYLKATQDCDGPRYEEVEPHAWRSLLARLRRLGVEVEKDDDDD